MLAQLRVLASGPVSALSEAVAQGLGRTGLQDVWLEGVEIGAPASLLCAPQLRRASIKLAAETELELAAHPTLEWLSVSSGCLRASLVGLRALRGLELGAPAVVLEGLCELRSLTGYARSLTVRDAPRLRSITMSSGPAELALEGTCALALVDAQLSSLPASVRSALVSAYPSCEFFFETPKHKKAKRTAPKRKLKSGEWRHPQFGLEDLSYAVLMAGRLCRSLSVARAKELGVVAEAWSDKAGHHLAAVLPEDLSSSSHLSSSDDVGPIVVGRVVRFVSADEGPSAAVTRHELQEEVSSKLAAEFWQECCGVVGHDELLTARTAAYLVSSGPLAQALLACGTVGTAATAGLVVGQDSQQQPHLRGVKGMLIDQVGLGDVARVELDERTCDPLHVLCRYD